MKRRSLLKSTAVLWSPGLAGGAETQPAAKMVSSSSAATTVETASGRVRGYVSRDVYVYRGIPYGAHTGEENRFLPPRPPQAWTGVRSCLTYGLTCPGGYTNYEGPSPADEDNFLLYRTGAWRMGEDCLRLNVWTRSLGRGGAKRPVMVWMHGGGYTGGSGNDLLSYDGENLARRHDVVVVTHNHRLNIFGFLNLAEWGGEQFAESGNVGMLDNVAVLEWVKTNIANFGGDPERVLIYGQSGGGGKVSHLMAMPAAKGLFHQVAVQSGSALRSGSAESASKVAAAVLDELGIPKSEVPRIQKVPARTLMGARDAALRKLAGGRPQPMGGWSPVVDGKVLPAHPFDPGAPAISAGVAMLIGTCLNEMVNGVDNPEVDTLTMEEVGRRVSERHGAKAGDIIAACRKEYPKESPFGIWAAIAAANMRLNARRQAERKAAQGGAPAYQYVYGWRTPMLDGRPGTFHSSEIAFVFDNGDLCARYSGGGPEAMALSHRMSEAWASLARTGNPNHKGLPKWPAYAAPQRATMFFDNECRIKSDPESGFLNLIAQT